MKLTFRSPDGSLTVEAEPKTIKDAFEAMGQINEFLICEPCGCCKSKATYPRSRKAKEFVFFEWVCRDCTATFKIHQNKEGGKLFISRNDKEGVSLPNKGWSIYEPNKQWSSGRNNQNHSQEPNREPQHYADEEVPF